GGDPAQPPGRKPSQHCQDARRLSLDTRLHRHHACGWHPEQASGAPKVVASRHRRGGAGYPSPREPSLGRGHGFLGWSPEAVRFLKVLQADNTKAYWSAHKAFYSSTRPRLRQRPLDRWERRRPLASRRIGRILAHRRLARPPAHLGPPACRTTLSIY